MRYLDTGGRDPGHALASWLEGAVREEVAEIRFQTGFFSLDGVGLLIPALEQCRASDRPTKILIGSNDASTLRDDVAGLMGILGIPRNHAHLGVVNFSGAYFHPKTYHIQRADGSQAAFVGSANLTASGLALHVEAGIALDTNEGDDPRRLSDLRGQQNITH
jgi:HKD family nuclease